MQKAESYRIASMDKPKTKDLACGHWIGILSRLTPELQEAIRFAEGGKRNHIPCPVHGGKDGFRLFDNVAETGGGVCNTCGFFPSGFDLLKWLKGWDFSYAASMVDDALGCGIGKITHSKPDSEDEKENQKRRERMNRIWRQSKSPEIVSDYLRSRGLKGDIPTDMRGIRALTYRDKSGATGIYPAIVAMIRDPNGKPISLHRIYLADVPSRKKTMPPIGTIAGGAVRLYSLRDKLAVAEGIETSIAAHEIFRLPVWACLTAQGMEDVVVPPMVRCICIMGRNG